MSGNPQINLEEYTSEISCTVSRNGGWEAENVQLSALLRIAKAAENIPRLADELEAITSWGNQVNLCRIVRAVPRIARALEKGITIRHEHSLSLKLSWSIKWPWSSRAKRGRGKLLFWKPRKKAA